jgi:hypothetical protein
MNLVQACQENIDSIYKNSQPVDPAIIEKFEQDLAKDYSNYLNESRATAKKTAELSKLVCVA